MKNIYLLTITFFLIVIAITRTSAQSKTSFEIEGTIGKPAQTPRSATILGGGVKVRKMLSDKWSVALGANIYTTETGLSGKSAASWTIYPLRAELRYNVYDEWFVQGKAGVVAATYGDTKLAWSTGFGKSWNNRWGVSLNYENFGYRNYNFIGLSVFYSPRFKKYKYNKMNLDKSQAWSMSVYGMYGTGLGETAGAYGNFGLEFANHLNDKLEIVADASYLAVGKGSDDYWVYNMPNMLVARVGLRYQFYKSLFVGGHVGVGFELPGFANMTGGIEVGSKLTKKMAVSLQLDKFQRYSAPLLGVKVGYKL